MLYGYPQGNLFYRRLDQKFPLIIRGEGVYLYDSEGKRYLDGSSGAVVVNIGHGVAEIAKALAEQAKNLAYVNGLQFTNTPAEALAQELALLSPPALKWAYFLSGGSEAVEAAVKLSLQYQAESGNPQKHRIISLFPSYHGNTIGALYLSARLHYRKFFAPLLPEPAFIPAPYCYRCFKQLVFPDCQLACADTLEEKILELGAEKVAAFIAEPVGGSSTGAWPPPPGYHEKVRSICDRHRVLFLADEVMCGMGRTGKWFAIQHYQAVPDVLILGKGLTGGYLPLSALLVKDELVKVLAENSGALLHAQTFTHHPLACTAGLACLNYLKTRNLVSQSAELGAYLLSKLKELQNHPLVGEVRGIGLFAGVELVADKIKKTPFPRKDRLAERLTAAALKKGLILWPNTGQADGENGDLVLLAPPFVITREQIDELVFLLKAALQELA